MQKVFMPEPVAQVSKYHNSDFRIVSEKRGDSILGYRVQRRRYNHGGEYWVKVGPRWYEIEIARNYRQFVEQQNMAPIVTEVIE